MKSVKAKWHFILSRFSEQQVAAKLVYSFVNIGRQNRSGKRLHFQRISFYVNINALHQQTLSKYQNNWEQNHVKGKRIFLQCSISCGLSRESQARVKSSGTSKRKHSTPRSYFPANNIINQQKSECFTQSPAFLQCWTAQKTAGCPVGLPVLFFGRPKPNVSRLRRPGASRAQPWSYLIL